MTAARPAHRPQTRNDRYIADIQGRINPHSGMRARLRRSVRGDGTLTADAYWLLGPWLPDDRDAALIMAQTAAWCAAHHQPGTAPQPPHPPPHPPPHAPPQHRTIGGQLGCADAKTGPGTAGRILELATRDGTPAAQRLHHIGRALAACPAPHQIDWARLMADISALDRGGERARRARTRWYRAYHTSQNPPDPADPADPAPHTSQNPPDPADPAPHTSQNPPESSNPSDPARQPAENHRKAHL